MSRTPQTSPKYPKAKMVLLWLFGSTMTCDAFMVGRGLTQRHNPSLCLQSDNNNEPTTICTARGMTQADSHNKNPLEKAAKAGTSVATGTLLALSLFFAPTQTADSGVSAPLFAVESAVAAKTVDATTSTLSQQELQLKSAKSAMTEATQSVKGVESRIKTLEDSLKKAEKSISASENLIKKSKKTLQQAEKSYRDLRKQKKPAKVLDKESQKVVKAKLAFQEVTDSLASAKGAKIDIKSQLKVAGSDLKAAQKIEKQAATKLATAESAFAKYQKQQTDAKKAAEAKAKAKLELEQSKAREKAAREKVAAAKAQKRAEERKQQLQTQIKDLQTELKNLQQKRKQASNPKVYDDQIATARQKLDALKKDVAGLKK